MWNNIAYLGDWMVLIGSEMKTPMAAWALSTFGAVSACIPGPPVLSVCSGAFLSTGDQNELQEKHKKHGSKYLRQF